MAEVEKVTMMKLKVDLDCSKCYKKLNKTLRKFPQIRGQVYDEKSNFVIIQVICSDPERIMNKLCYKGGGSIKSIEILQPVKAPPPPVQSKPKELEKAVALAPVPVQVPVRVPVQVPMEPQVVGRKQEYQCGPYYEAQINECYGRPIYDSFGGGIIGGPPRHCTGCHVSYEENTQGQGCFIM